MNSGLRNLALGALLSAGALVSSGCVQEEESLIITQANSLTASEDGACSSDNSATPLGVDVLDVSFGTGYVASFTLLNQLPTRTSNNGIDDNELKVTSVDVRLDTPQDPSIISSVDPAFVEFNTPVATNSLSPGNSLAYVVEVPASAMDAVGTAIGNAVGTDTTLTMTMTVTFRAVRAANVYGNGLGEIESRSFTLPIKVCAGCLLECLPTEVTTTNAMGVEETVDVCTLDNCLNATTFEAGGACGNAQTNAVNPACCVGTENFTGTLASCGL